MITTSLTARVFIDLAIAVSFHWSLTPPNPPVAKAEVIARGLFERTIRTRAVLDKAFVWATAVLDIANSFGWLGPKATPDVFQPSIPPLLIIGAFICVTANLWRLWAFSALGKFFDFEFRIQSNHRLITAGPYSYVRHPSYTGLFALYIGVSLVVLTPGHWMKEFGMASMVGIVIGGYWFFEVVLVLVALTRRMKAEDEGLMRAFGKQWHEYAQRVPRRLLPFIY